jgi:hypothetical protein
VKDFSMTAFYYDAHGMTLPDGLENIGEYKQAVGQEMRRAGFTNVQDSGVSGEKPGIIVLVIYLYIADRGFWQVIMVSGDDGATTLQTFNDVKAMIQHMDIHII